MGKFFTGLAAALMATVLLAPGPASAGFTISKPKPTAQQPAPTAKPPRRRPPRTPRQEETPQAEPPVAVVTGIDPALMQEVVLGAKYKATLERDPAAHTAALKATDGKSGWTVNFSECVEDSKCGKMEFYTLWRVSNEANVCTVWGRDVAKDPTGVQGKPFCYTVPALERQLHLKLSSSQAPYVGLDKMTPEEARGRMQSMVGVWQTYVPMLPQAWTIASSKCPRASDKCGGTSASSAASGGVAASGGSY